MLAELRKVRFPVETGLLIAFCIFLPLVEMPEEPRLAALRQRLAPQSARARVGRPLGPLGHAVRALDRLGLPVAAFAGCRAANWAAAELARYALLGWAGEARRLFRQGTALAAGRARPFDRRGTRARLWRLATGAAKNGALQLHRWDT
jgi:hypothetical protein